MKINKRKIQYASVSTVFIALFVVVILIFNALASFLTNRFSLKLDLTATGEYSLDEQSIEILKELQEDITVYVMDSEAEVTKSPISNHMLETLRRYNTASGGKVKYEFIDPNQNPKFFDDYPLAKASKEGEKAAFFIVSGARRYKPIMYKDMFRVSNASDNPDIYYLTESALSSAITFVTSPKVSKFAKISGHNETTVAGFESIVIGNNIELSTVNLSSENIPDDVNNIIIGGAQVDFTPAEIAKVDEFLKNPGNNVYVFWNCELSANLPVLERFLDEWGMQISPNVVLDQQMSYGASVNVMCTLVDNDVTSDIVNTELMVHSMQSHPINILWEEKGYTRTLPLAISGNNSYSRFLSSAANITDGRGENEDKGPFNVAVLSEKRTAEDKANRVFLFGSDMMAAESVIGTSIALNNSFFNKVLSYSSDGMKTVQIMPKVSATNDLNFYESQIALITNILVIFVPIIILAVGLFIFFRRRHR